MYLLIEIAFAEGDRLTLLKFEVRSPLITNREKTRAAFLYCNTSIFSHHPGDHIWKGKIKFGLSVKSVSPKSKGLSKRVFICCWIRFLLKRGQTGNRDLSCMKPCPCWVVPPHRTRQEQGSPRSPPPCGSMMNDEFPGLWLKRERPGKSCIPVNHEDKIGVQSLLLKGWESSCTSGLSTPTQDICSPRLRQNGPTWSLATPAIVAICGHLSCCNGKEIHERMASPCVTIVPTQNGWRMIHWSNEFCLGVES